MTQLTVVAYHYIRDLERSRFPDIKGRRTSEFISQIDYLQRNYNIISAHDLLNKLSGSHELPPKPLLLTFDDGFIDHFTNVLPILEEKHLKGAFFPAIDGIKGELLHVHKIHFILATIGAGRVINYTINYIKNNNLLEFWEKDHIPSRFDSEELIHTKQMLQYVLPEWHRNAIVNKLFSTYVSDDFNSFASELYMTESQLKLMVGLGHYIGHHSISHSWMNRLDPQTQEIEVVEPLKFLGSIGAINYSWIMCYPYGVYNKSLLEIIKKHACVCAFTGEMGVSDLSGDLFDMPRLDTNDLPLG